MTVLNLFFCITTYLQTSRAPPPLDVNEPANVAEAIHKYVILQQMTITNQFIQVGA